MFEICLKTLARTEALSHTQLVVNERLPLFIESPCRLEVNYSVKKEADDYILKLHLAGKLNIICQRCLASFEHPYEKETVFAICKTEARASAIMDQYESFVSGHLIDLMELVTDELYISAPDKHEAVEDCDKEIIELMGQKEN